MVRDDYHRIPLRSTSSNEEIQDDCVVEREDHFSIAVGTSTLQLSFLGSETEVVQVGNNK